MKIDNIYSMILMIIYEASGTYSPHKPDRHDHKLALVGINRASEMHALVNQLTSPLAGHMLGYSNWHRQRRLVRWSCVAGSSSTNTGNWKNGINIPPCHISGLTVQTTAIHCAKWEQLQGQQECVKESSFLSGPTAITGPLCSKLLTDHHELAGTPQAIVGLEAPVVDSHFDHEVCNVSMRSSLVMMDFLARWLFHLITEPRFYK